MEIVIKQLDSEQLKDIWIEAFHAFQINRPIEYYNSCLEENLTGTRVTLFAFSDKRMVGCSHLKFQSDYPFFCEHAIPEINDLNVFEPYRRQGVANKLIEQFEMIASMSCDRIGIGVGLFDSYGAAQRLYCRRGYILDGKGLMYKNEPVAPGDMVRVDDDLNLYFTKELNKV